MMNEYDIRNIYPEIEDSVTITGDLTKILNDEQFKDLTYKGRIAEWGADGNVGYIKFQYLFTVEDVKKKIEEILKGE